MAVNNTLTSVIPTLYAQGLSALRSNLVMPGLVMNDFGTEVREKGETIQIPLPSDMTTTDVVPAAYAPDPQNIAPTTATIPLTNWKESAFTLTEKEYAQVVAGVVPIQLTAAVQSLAAAVNASIMGNYISVGNYIGTAGTTPFGSSDTITPATTAGKILTQQLAPLADRRIVLDPTAYANATSLPNFSYALYSGDTQTVDEGIIRRKFGFDWAQDQQVVTHTSGTLTGAVTASGAQAAGVTTVTLATDAAGAVNLLAGDVITFSGDTQTYAVLAASTIGASATGTVTIFPAKVVALAGGETVSVKASHVVNLAFHQQAFGFASRPLKGDMFGRDPDMEMMIPDPVSGISMRLIIREEYHRTRVAYDILWGTNVIRPQLAVRIAG